MDPKTRRVETTVIHGGDRGERYGGAVVLPIFQSATFLYQGEASYEEVRYIRLNNTPNHLVLQSRLAQLEGGEAALVTASGMAAISAALFSLLGTGDHLLAQKTLYGGTFDLLAKDFPALGIEFDLLDPADPESWEKLVRPTTRALLVESISNPRVEIGNLPALVRFARQHGLVSLIDNTFATPVNFRPLEHGFDLVAHSCTKYLNGHSDIVAGAVIGSAERVAAANRKLLHFGGCLDPHACFLLERGMKTLVLRVRHQNESASRIAGFLSQHPRVKRVFYPGLENWGHPEGKALFSGFGGMLSFELQGNPDLTRDFLSRLEIPVEAPSLGGVESLVTRPSTTSHAGLSREQREALGIRDGLIRFSVGIESTDDLIEDLGQALR
jgi:cystathionine beta-lyase/cystathionine gamma-synthase